MLFRYLIMTALACCLAGRGMAQAYNGMHKYDGEHPNVLTSYLMVGDNILCDHFYGLEASYTRHLTDRWHVGGDMQVQMGKQLYSVDVQGGYRLPVKWMDFYLDGKVMYNRYQRWGTNEIMINLSLTWETPYFYLRFGETYIHYNMLDFGYSEPLTLTVGTGVNIRPRWDSWNIGLFIRNYDDFYYEAYNINWGANFWANLMKDVQLFGEVNLRPAGSLSQLATEYEKSLKLGLRYVW